MSGVYPLLAAVRDQLKTAPGVVTSRIGLEANMTPDDYPMVRVVPSLVRDGPGISRRTVRALIYFGRPIHEFEGGLEALWSELLAMETKLIDLVQQTQGAAVIYHDTVLDEDRSDAYKLLALRVDIIG